MTDKLIVTNATALSGKYGAAGWRRIRDAVGRLVAADRRRGLVAKLVLLDDARQMRARGAEPVAGMNDYAGAKRAIDAAFRADTPAYLMILGAFDVVPHQPILNPVYAAPDDPDGVAWSDLPYACSGRYDTDIAAFTGPTRVVGRLPDLQGAWKPSQADYLVRLLDAASRWKSRPVDDYLDHFALSAKVWRESSARNLVEIFGTRERLRTSPPSGPGFDDDELAPLVHFINCHGDEGVPEFRGQVGEGRAARYPEALTTRAIARRIETGTVAAAECCYGAQLYPADLIGTDIPICQSYLKQGAYGFFGSTTIAYGDDATIDSAADLMVQRFLLEVLAGRSLGHAALKARQDFVASRVDLDPIELKTLAQFVLLGDPSVCPVASARESMLLPRRSGGARSRARRGATAASVAAGERERRHERRVKLAVQGEFLQATRATASRGAKRPLPKALSKALAGLAKRAGVGSKRPFVEYAVQPPRTDGVLRRGRKPLGGRRFFVAVKKPARAPRGPHAIAIVAKAVGARIVDVRRYRQR